MSLVRLKLDMKKHDNAQTRYAKQDAIRVKLETKATELEGIGLDLTSKLAAARWDHSAACTACATAEKELKQARRPLNRRVSLETKAERAQRIARAIPALDVAKGQRNEAAKRIKDLTPKWRKAQRAQEAARREANRAAAKLYGFIRV